MDESTKLDGHAERRNGECSSEQLADGLQDRPEEAQLADEITNALDDIFGAVNNAVEDGLEDLADEFDCRTDEVELAIQQGDGNDDGSDGDSNWPREHRSSDSKTACHLYGKRSNACKRPNESEETRSELQQ